MSGGPCEPPPRQNDSENRVSRNSPSLAVALTCGMGSSSLNAEVNALERLQIVRERNSSYFGSRSTDYAPCERGVWELPARPQRMLRK
jgi:hypothetical protein